MVSKVQRRHYLSRQLIEWLRRLPTGGLIAGGMLPIGGLMAGSGRFVWNQVNRKRSKDAWLMMEVDGTEMLVYILAFCANFSARWTRLVLQPEGTYNLIEASLVRMPNAHDAANGRWFVFTAHSDFSETPHDLVQNFNPFIRIPFTRLPNSPGVQRITPSLSMSAEQWRESTWWSRMTEKQHTKLLDSLFTALQCADIIPNIVSFFRL
jgi:hypothetical protein